MTSHHISEAIRRWRNRHGYSPAPLRAALIDMDGVLYDSMPLHARAWMHLMADLGIAESPDTFFRLEGMTGAETLRLIFRRHGLTEPSPDRVRELYAEKTRYFGLEGERAVMAGAREALEALRSAGVERVLVTGSGQRSLLDRIEADFPGAFSPEHRVTAADVVHGKPDPEPYRRGMEKAQAAASQCMVVENAPLGVKAGAAAGCFTVAAATGPLPQSELTDAGADLTVGSMSALAAILPEIHRLFCQP